MQVSAAQIKVRTATPADVDRIVSLVNPAFARERFFKDGDRTTPAKVKALLEKGKFFIAEDASSPVGCIYVELRGDRGYFGLLAIDINRQRSGIGSLLISVAEDDCRAAGCLFIDLTIVNLRTELYGYYRKLGYAEDGTLPFPEEQLPTKVPCHLIKMSKPLT